MTNGISAGGGKPSRLFSFIHIGDLHLTNLAGTGNPVSRAQEKTLRSDVAAMLKEIRKIDSGRPGFIYLPGDIADNGRSGEYEYLRKGLRQNRSAGKLPPVYLIPGDHDRQWGRMAAFARFRSRVRTMRKIRPKANILERLQDGGGVQSVLTPQFYYARVVRGVRCIFLDLISAGYGRKGFGLDFRLGPTQLTWLFRQIGKARTVQQPCAVFMHCYPHDMADRDERVDLAGLFWNEGVCLVEMGHTHYNELAPDGRTLYAAARSVGQNEDGPVGYAVGAIDAADARNVVTSWRFKQLQLGLPFVLITTPADRRLATGPLNVCGPKRLITVRALVMSEAPIAAGQCECSVDRGRWVPMNPIGDGVFEVALPWPEGSKHISVRVTVALGTMPATYRSDTDTIEPATVDFEPPSMPDEPGSDAQRLASWTVKGLRGDQAGPNRSGYRW